MENCWQPKLCPRPHSNCCLSLYLNIAGVWQGSGKCSWGPGKSRKVLEIIVTKRVGTLYISLCLSVIVSAGLSQKPHVQTSWNVLHMLPVVVAWCFSDDSAVRYVLFVDDVMFSHNGQWGRITDDVIFWQVHQVTAPGAKYDVYECLVEHFLL